MKKLINAPERFVADTLAAFAQVHGELVRADLDNTVCLRREPLPRGHVALISGGGSGHEPLHAGFVGDGMLAAAVLGDIFASPNADQVLAACRDEGHRDVRPPPGSPDGTARGRAPCSWRRSPGRLPPEGAPLAEVKAIAERVVDASRSIGFALTSCTTPMAGRPTFALGPDEIEFGVGIHGEQGIGRRRMATASGTRRGRNRPPARRSEPRLRRRAAHAHQRARRHPRERAVPPSRRSRPRPHRTRSPGRPPPRRPYVTSLDMAGASISLLVLDEELKRLWDAPVTTAALSR